MLVPMSTLAFPASDEPRSDIHTHRSYVLSRARSPESFSTCQGCAVFRHVLRDCNLNVAFALKNVLQSFARSDMSVSESKATA